MFEINDIKPLLNLRRKYRSCSDGNGEFARSFIW